MIPANATETARTMDSQAETIERLEAENAELRRVLAIVLANSSAGMSRGFLRAAHRPSFHPLITTLEL